MHSEGTAFRSADRPPWLSPHSRLRDTLKGMGNRAPSFTESFFNYNIGES